MGSGELENQVLQDQRVNPEALTSKLKDEHEVAREMVGTLFQPQEPRKSGSHLGTIGVYSGPWNLVDSSRTLHAQVEELLVTLFKRQEVGDLS